MGIRQGRRVLLLGPRRYLVEARGSIETKFGVAKLEKLVGKPIGTRLKVGKSTFTAVEPTLLDFLAKNAKRGPAVVLPKDAAAILAHTGAGKGWKAVDAGTGSGWLSLFLANIGCEVTSYEVRKDFFGLVRKNVQASGLKVKLKNRDVTKGISERNVDLVTLDMKNPEKAIPHAYRALKPGGWIAIFSMHVEEVSAIVKGINKLDFTPPHIVELLERGWQSEIHGKKAFTRPRTHMLAHTGFLTFARKV